MGVRGLARGLDQRGAVIAFLVGRPLVLSGFIPNPTILLEWMYRLAWAPAKTLATSYIFDEKT